jgi:endonuclease III
MDKRKVDSIFARLAAANPDPKTELYSTNDFTLLVAIVLSAQATDAGVNKATPALFRIAATPQEMAALGEVKLKNYIKTIGLFNSKAKNIIALSHKLVEEFGGRIPETREALQTLPGVGRKTANVWLNCARGHETIAVDTHVAIPGKWKLHAHHWLILHGRYVCKARKPECARCALNDLCPSALSF